jgi:hypothetical protein
VGPGSPESRGGFRTAPEIESLDRVPVVRSAEVNPAVEADGPIADRGHGARRRLVRLPGIQVPGQGSRRWGAAPALRPLLGEACARRVAIRPARIHRVRHTSGRVAHQFRV